MTLLLPIRPATGGYSNINVVASGRKMLGDLMKEADRKGLINLRNAYHDASVVKSKRGPKTR